MKQDANKQRIFITGGAGFIGTNLVKFLLDKDEYDITVYDNLSEGSKENLDKAISNSQEHSKVVFIKGDILDFDKLFSAVSGHDSVIHLAAHTKVVESIENPKESLAVNSTGTFNVLEAARINNIGKFVFASSNATVGEQIPPINESMVAKPLSPYGAVKLYGEALCSAYYHCYSLKTVAFRFANAYGPYSEHKTSVVAKFLKRAKQGQSLEIYGDGNQTRDFIHAQEIAQAIHLLIEYDTSQPGPWGEVFQIATGLETKIGDLAQKIVDHFSLGKEKITFSKERAGEIRKNFSDVTKAQKILGFSYKIKLDEGIKELLKC